MFVQLLNSLNPKLYFKCVFNFLVRLYFSSTCDYNFFCIPQVILLIAVPENEKASEYDDSATEIALTYDSCHSSIMKLALFFLVFIVFTVSFITLETSEACDSTSETSSVLDTL